MLKKLLCVLLVCFMVLPLFGKTSFIYADDEEETGDVVIEEEKSNKEKCLQDKDKEACQLEIQNRNKEKNRIGRYSELISTISATASVAKITFPIIFIISILFILTWVFGIHIMI